MRKYMKMSSKILLVALLLQNVGQISGCLIDANKLDELLLIGQIPNYADSDTVNLTHCEIPALSAKHFKGLEHTKYLLVSDNLIHEISKDTFKELINLRVLKIDGNSITYVKIEDLTFSNYELMVIVDEKVIIKDKNVELHKCNDGSGLLYFFVKPKKSDGEQERNTGTKPTLTGGLMIVSTTCLILSVR